MHCARRVLLLTILVMVCPVTVEAKNQALLIGVSNYQLAAIPKLKAPKNDVALMWDLLRDRGFLAEDIDVLADEIDPGHKQPIPHGMPTANNILHELDALAARVKKNDLIVVYYSGHGSYIRQETPKVGETIEQSGFNQVLLAIDAQEADDIKAEVPGGILDKVLKTKFDEIKEKVFLWLILDSCFAGGLTRDVTVDATVHFVPPSLLNLDNTPPPFDAEPNRWIAGGIGGKQVAFLAAPEDSPAFEKPVSDLGNKPYSLFTQSLVRLLRGENFGSYRSLGEAIISKQAALPGNVPTPVIEGDLDQPIFEGSVAGPRMWDAKYEEAAGEILVDAGSLQGIATDTIVSLETSQGLVGYGEVEISNMLSSLAHPIAFHDKPKPSASQLKEKLMARVVRSTIDLTLKVAVPRAVDSDGSKTSRAGLQAIELLRKEENSPLPIRWLEAGGSADVYLRLINGVIYLVPGTGELVREGRRQTPGIAISDSDEVTAGDLKENLWRMLRQLNLRRAANEVQGTDFAKAVDVRLNLIRDEDEVKAVIRNERQPCRSWDRDPDTIPPRPLELGSLAGIKLTHCDRVRIEVANRWPKAVDVTLLYLDSEGGIGAVGKDNQPRVKAGTAFFPQKYQVKIVTWCNAKIWGLCKDFKTTGYQPIGAEGLLVIITEAGATDHTYYYLAQERLAKAVERRGRAERAGVPLEELLIDAGLHPGQARGIVDKAVPGAIKLFSWDVVPPAELGP
jgi:Caspase domain